MPATDLIFRIRAYLHDHVAPGDLSYRGDEHPVSLLQEVLEELPDLREEVEQLDMGLKDECDSCMEKTDEIDELERQVREQGDTISELNASLDDARCVAIESRRVADLVLARLNTIRREIVDKLEPEELEPRTGMRGILARILDETQPVP